MHVLRVVRVLLPVLIVAAVVGAGSSVLSARPDLQKAKRNVDTFRKRVRSSVSEKELTLMCDAQTSGGLLIAVAPEKAEQLAARFDESGLFYAKVGTMTGEKGVVALVG